jgi:two-component system, OmpR family, KDP operon response regulator KdpE
MTRALVVDDEPQLLRALTMNLTARGYDVTPVSNGTAALDAAAAERFDVIVLDLGLPDIDGMAVIKGVRRVSDIPIVVLSARTDSSDKVQALDLGADDYVTKPFNVDELLARLRAATRRPALSDGSHLVQLGSVQLDLDAKTASRAGEEGIHLTPTEWRLLELLVTAPDKLRTSRSLLIEMRGDPATTDPSYLRVHMASLRRKLEETPGRPRHLITEPGMGYRFKP